LNARLMKSAVRFAVTWLAAWCQVVVVATMPLGPFVGDLNPFGSVPICHAGADDSQPTPSQPSHTGHDCVLCVVCQSHGEPLALIPPDPVLARHPAVSPAHFAIAQPRAPPPLTSLAARPRGPPSLS
jgi:hypothetical protein